MLLELRHFLLIEAHGTFTRAAKEAHLSQPALTASIRRLEDRCGARVFDRGRKGASLTAEGQALLPRARAAIAAFEDGMRAVAEVSRLETGRVCLGAGATVSTYLLPPILAAFAAEHPGVRYELRESTTADSLVAVEKGDLDLAIVADGPGEPWRTDELILIRGPGDSPDASPSGAPFVTLGADTTTRAHLDRAFPEADIVMELNSIAAVKGNVRAGVGIALLSRTAVEGDLARGDLITVADPRVPIRREFRLAHRGIDRLPPATAALRRLLLGG